MDNSRVWEELDEEERIYAPEQLPAEEQVRVRADEGAVHRPPNEPLPAAPVANIGTAPSGEMAPQALEPEDEGGAPDPAASHTLEQG